MKLKYIRTFNGLIFILCMMGFYATAQEETNENLKADSLSVITDETDTVTQKISGSLNRIEISIDYLKFASFAFPDEMKMEGGLGFISKFNVGINVEVGYGEKTPDDFYKNAEYKMYGYYGRIGLSYYYPFSPGVNFIIGAKYAMSQYQDEASFTVLSSLWDDYNDDFQRTGLKASWAELVLGSESSVKGNLYFGFFLRFRMLIEADNFDPFEVYSIPGYGRTFDNFVPALNLYLKYIIPFGKNK